MNNFIFKKYVQFIERNGYFPMIFNPYNCSEIFDVSPTITANCGSTTSSAAVLISNLGGDEIMEFYTLRYERTEYAKRIRKDYESKRIKERRCNMRKWGIRNDGLCNTLSTVQKDNYLLEVTYKDDKDMNNEPFIVASRGRNPENPSDRTTGSPTEQRLEPNTKGLCNTLTTVQKDNYVCEPLLRIRKLTPKECFRLMGFDDEDFTKAEAVNSNTQLYKQAGNSIVVPVVEHIISALIDCGAI